MYLGSGELAFYIFWSLVFTLLLVCCHLPTQLYLVFLFLFLYNGPQEACILRIRLALQAASLATDQADGVGADGRNAEQDGRRKKRKLTEGEGEREKVPPRLLYFYGTVCSAGRYQHQHEHVNAWFQWFVGSGPIIGPTSSSYCTFFFRNP